MSRYIYSVKSVKYGTITGTNTIPASLTQLPDTVKGSVNIDETEGSSTKFYVDQKKDPIKNVKTEEGELTATMQFYDFTYTALAAFKGGTAPTGGGTGSFAFVPATGYTDVNKALVIELDSGEKLNIFNGNCFARITGGGGRDKMLSWELKVVPQMTADLAGSWDIETP
jgi:hypothetical protein